MGKWLRGEDRTGRRWLREERIRQQSRGSSEENIRRVMEQEVVRSKSKRT